MKKLVAGLLLGFLCLSWPISDFRVTTREYAPGLQLDLLELAEAPAGPRPVLLFLHGGGWRNGNRKWLEPIVGQLVRDGWLGVSIDYRLSGQARFPAQLEDCAAAVAWLRAHARELAVDPERIVVCGSSAGGHLAALLGTSGKARVHAVIDLFGPTDLIAERQQGPRDTEAPDSFESGLLGGPPSQRPELARAANPITHVDSDDPPMLILHGEQDVLVPAEQSRMLARALEEAGVPVRLVILPDGHGLREHSDRVYREVKAFLADGSR